MDLHLVDGRLFIGQNDYLCDFINSNAREFDLKCRNVLKKDVEAVEGEAVDNSLIDKYRCLIGVLGWLTKTRPPLAVYFSKLASHSNKPTLRLYNTLKRLLLCVRDNPSSLELCAVKGSPVIHAYSDASYDRVQYQCRTGHRIFLGTEKWEHDNEANNIAWNTKGHKRKIASSTSAELLGLMLVVKAVWPFVDLVSKLWRCTPGVKFYIDNAPLCQQLMKGSCKEEPRLNPQLDYVLENINELAAEVVHVPRDKQKADCMTKLTTRF
eukprot:GHVU01149705.1.p1 GENE.GHVU01149705.1~~GHVU01149705.1.p1  ORF type:complete len:267 (+),score=18.50 GHVU01149705.1:687-1487(+)